MAKKGIFVFVTFPSWEEEQAARMTAACLADGISAFNPLAFIKAQDDFIQLPVGAYRETTKNILDVCDVLVTSVGGTEDSEVALDVGRAVNGGKPVLFWDWRSGVKVSQMVNRLKEYDARKKRVGHV